MIACEDVCVWRSENNFVALILVPGIESMSLCLCGSVFTHWVILLVWIGVWLCIFPHGWCWMFEYTPWPVVCLLSLFRSLTCSCCCHSVVCLLLDALCIFVINLLSDVSFQVFPFILYSSVLWFLCNPVLSVFAFSQSLLRTVSLYLPIWFLLVVSPSWSHQFKSFIPVSWYFICEKGIPFIDFPPVFHQFFLLHHLSKKTFCSVALAPLLADLLKSYLSIDAVFVSRVSIMFGWTVLWQTVYFHLW